eukprot:TRINITY_DN434_c0_g1_i1.p1 TRINITY_DN434_c0_g1~~TRINITY_DN434_c0_g1_i1.p1  ORF type:complete len:1505 (-),score=539.00 TRINITY_DN434_c0_g1_i1:68-4582(-)
MSNFTERTVPPDWVEVQRKTFTRWCNQHLRPTGRTLQDLEGDLHTGTNLIYLLEELSGTSLGKFYVKPRSRFEELLNVTSGINFIKSKNIPLVAIGPEDIVDKNQKLVLGLVWMLILRYQIQKGNKDGKMKSAGAAKNELLEWVKNQVKPFGVECNNFNTSFQDGQVLSALVESLKPGSVDIDAIKRVKKDDKATAFANTKSAIGKANDLFDIPVLMEAEDLVYPLKPDDLSVMTYVSYFRDYQPKDKAPVAKAAAPAASSGAGAAKPPATADEINNSLRCLVFGQGVEVPEIGRPNEFLVSIYHSSDKKPYDPSPKDKVTITLYEPTGDGKFKPIELPNVSPSSTGQGHFKTSFTPKQEGGYEVLVKLNGVPVKGRGRIRVRSSENDVLPSASATGVDPKNCNATGEGLKTGEVGKDCKFVIHTNNSKNEAVKHGGEVFNVEILDKSGNRVPNVIPAVTDNQDGTYGVTYRVPKDGEYKVSIKHGSAGTPIAGSPYGPVTIHPRSGNQIPIDWNNVKIEGLNTKVLKNKPESFKIIPAGENGKKITEGGEQFKVAVWALDPDTRSLPVTVNDNKDGTYTVSYTADEPGRLKIAISGIDRVNDGVEKKVGTYDAVCAEGELDENNTEITGDGINGPVYAYRENSFVVVPKDGNGKFINIDPQSDLVISINDDTGKPVSGLRVEPESEDEISKGYRVFYTPTKTGKHKYSLASKKKPFKNFPRELEVVEKFDPTKSYCEGKGAEPKVTTKKPMEFKIVTVDAKGNKVTTGGDKFEVKLKSEDDPSAKEIKALVRDNGDGTYYVRYSVPKDGKYKMAVTTHNGTKHIKDSPLSLTAGVGEDFACLEFASFIGEGKPLTSTVENFDVEVKGPNDHFEAFSTTDIDIGRYAVNFTPTSGPGTYWISVRLQGNHITNSPFKLEVQGYTNPAAQREGATESAVRATRFGIKPVIDGKTIPDFNPADWTTEVRGPPKLGHKLPAKLERNPDTKQLAVIFTPEHNGLHEVDVKYKGKHIDGSTFALNVKTVPGEPIIDDNDLYEDEEEEQKPAAAAPKAAQTAAPQVTRTKFPFTAKDKSGKEIRTPVKGNKDWEFAVHGPTDQLVEGSELTEPNPNSANYGVIFPTTQGNGVYKITVKNKGDHVQGSVFRVQVGPAAPAAGAPAGSGTPGKLVQFPIKTLPEGGVGNQADWKAEVLGPPHRTPEDVVPGVQLNFDKVASGGPVGVIFQPRVPGHHKISVTKNGVPIPGSTFNVNIPPWDGAPAAPAAGAASAPSAGASTQTKTKLGMRREEEEPSVTKTRGPAWRPIPGASFARFTFGEQVDEEATNKKLSELPLEDLEVGVVSPEGKEVACKIYEKTGVIWQPQVPGDYEVNVYIKGRLVASCPWIVPVSGNQDDMYKSATVKFSVLAKTREGKLITGKGISKSMKGGVKGPNGEKVDCKVVSSSEGKGEEEGRFDVVWAPAGPGTYEITMEHDGQLVAGCPFRIAMGESRGAALPQTAGARTEEDAVDT